MQRYSNNPANYYLTQDGVISKIDTYWDRLRDTSEELDVMTRYTFRRLINVFCGSVMGILPVLWLSPSKPLGMFILVGVLSISMLLAAIQLVALWEFQAVKKRGKIIFDALKAEIEREYFEEEDMPLEERIFLNHYLLSSRFPIHPFLYCLMLLALIASNSTVLWIYSIYWK